MWGWGWNLAGQLGDGTFTLRPDPVQSLPASAGAVKVDAGITTRWYW